MADFKKHRVLVAPLDWGLGHASRCVPVIHALIRRGFEVVLAADKAPLLFLRKSFPKLEYHQLEGLTINYSSRLPNALAIALQSPAFLASIRKEQKKVAQLVEDNNIDAIISDNRYGVHHPKVPSILLTHQLNLQLPFGASIANAVLKNYMRKFKAIWVPDFPSTKHNLSGALSHNSITGNHVNFIGPLSQFTAAGVNTSNSVQRKLLVLLSGPEPSRTQFEESVLEQLKEIDFEVLFVRGLPSKEKKRLSDNPKVNAVNFLNGEALQAELLRSDVILCRSGYSSIMDLFTLNKKAILVPTAGQYEQEYLAKHVAGAKLFYTVKENALHLPTDLDKVSEYHNSAFKSGPDLLDKQIEWLENCLNPEAHA
jgi:uncharacterized protein (TIGR00661 family)